MVSKYKIKVLTKFVMKCGSYEIKKEIKNKKMIRHICQHLDMPMYQLDIIKFILYKTYDLNVVICVWNYNYNTYYYVC